MKGLVLENVLFLCTGNSCRSQMAEGWARALWGEKFKFFSAGIETHGLNPNALKVMGEAGVDISTHKSELLDEIDEPLDYVLTVCDHAKESCPVLATEVKCIHIPFPDPPAMAREVEGEEEQLNCYRTVRDQIRQTMEELPKLLA